MASKAFARSLIGSKLKSAASTPPCSPVRIASTASRAPARQVDRALGKPAGPGDLPRTWRKRCRAARGPSRNTAYRDRRDVSARLPLPGKPCRKLCEAGRHSGARGSRVRPHPALGGDVARHAVRGAALPGCLEAGERPRSSASWRLAHRRGRTRPPEVRIAEPAWTSTTSSLAGTPGAVVKRSCQQLAAAARTPEGVAPAVVRGVHCERSGGTGPQAGLGPVALPGGTGRGRDGRSGPPARGATGQGSPARRGARRWKRWTCCVFPKACRGRLPVLCEGDFLADAECAVSSAIRARARRHLRWRLLGAAGAAWQLDAVRSTGGALTGAWPGPSDANCG